MRNDLTIHDRVADRRWSDDVRWVRTLKNLVPGRLAWFDRHLDWPGKDALDLGCAGGFMAGAMAARGANVTGIDPAAQAIAAACARAGCSFSTPSTAPRLRASPPSPSPRRCCASCRAARTTRGRHPPAGTARGAAGRGGEGAVQAAARAVGHGHAGPFLGIAGYVLARFAAGAAA